MEEFESYRQGLFKERFAIALSHMAIPLYLLFSLVDYFEVRKFWYEFLVIRLAVCVFLTVIWFRIKNFKGTIRQLKILSYCFTGIMGTGIGYMTWRLGGFGSLYYEGLNWITLGALIFWPWDFGAFSASIFTIYGPLAILQILWPKSVGSSAILAVIFMTGTVFLSYLVNRSLYEGSKREFYLRTELEKLIKNKDTIIEAKTTENTVLAERAAAIKLARLMAHDIRSPLAALEAVLDTTSHVPDDSRELLQNVAQRIREIANDLLKKTIEEKRKCSVAFLLKSIVSEKRLEASLNTGIQIRFEEESDELFVDVRPVEFSRVLSNVINNAVESIESRRGIVTIGTHLCANKVLISISDSGKGVPAHILPKLGQQEMSYGKAAGSGLGLYNAKDIINSLDGELQISSIEGKGTVVKIFLPKVN